MAHAMVTSVHTRAPEQAKITGSYTVMLKQGGNGSVPFGPIMLP